MKKLLWLLFLITFLVAIGFVAPQECPNGFIAEQIPCFGANCSPTYNCVQVIFPAPNQIPPISQAQMDCFNKGDCYSFIPSIFSSNCYPTGYVFNGTYCSQSITHDNYAFLNQSKEGQSCTQNYECLTGICSDNICVNLTKQINELNKLKQGINFVNNNLSNLTQSINNTKNLENLSQTNSTSITGYIVNQNGGLFTKIINFFKRIFNL